MNAQLQEQVNALEKEKESDQVETYKGGRYTDEVRECIIHLLTLNVGINNINEVVECVLKLAGKKCSKLPSRSKINDSAQAILDELATILQDLTAIASTQTCSDVGNKILTNIKSTMSDRASVERSFNEL